MLLLFNKSESLECAKIVVLKLGAIQDPNRYIPQKINEFASLALDGRYP